MKESIATDLHITSRDIVVRNQNNYTLEDDFYFYYLA